MVTALDKIEVNYIEQRIKLLVHRILARESHDLVTNSTYYKLLRKGRILTLKPILKLRNQILG